MEEEDGGRYDYGKYIAELSFRNRTTLKKTKLDNAKLVLDGLIISQSWKIRENHSKSARDTIGKQLVSFSSCSILFLDVLRSFDRFTFLGNSALSRFGKYSRAASITAFSRISLQQEIFSTVGINASQRRLILANKIDVVINRILIR